MSLVGWNKICVPKNHGGLGFRKMDEMIQALLMKLSWEVVSNSDKLWAKIFCSKYGLDSRNLPMSLPDKPGSQIWRAIRSTWLATIQGARWSVCDGGRLVWVFILLFRKTCLGLLNPVLFLFSLF